MKRASAPLWTALLRRGLAVAACLFVLFTATAHVQVDASASAVPSHSVAATPSSGTADLADDGLPCPAIHHHCCEGASASVSHVGTSPGRSTPASYPAGRYCLLADNGRAPPVEPPRT